MPAMLNTSNMNNPRVRQLFASIAEGAGRLDALHLARNSLNGGELSPGMDARFDQPRYQSGCHSLLNMVPLPCGGITKRPGLECMGQAGTSPNAPERLVPFIFSRSESRMLEIFGTGGGSSAMRVWTPEGECLRPKVALPFRDEHLADVCFCQSADVIFYAHPAYPPGKIMRYGDMNWRVEAIDWLPSLPAPVILSAETVGDIPSGENSRTTYRYVATAVDGETGEESLQSAEVVVEDAAPLSQSYYVEIRIQAVEGASEYRIYKKSAGVYGYVGRVADADTAFEDRNIKADTEDTPPDARNPFAGAGNWPSVVFLHQQRLGYAASTNHPLTIWLSQAGNFESMAASVPPDDDDAIEATLAAPQANRILWAISDRNGLAFGTEGGEWLLRASDGAAISPKDLSFEPQTSHGSQPGLQVLKAGAGMLFCQRGGRVVREFGYSFQDDRYNSADVSLLARHILEQSPVTAWCWQPEPYGIVWAALANGRLAGLTYLREHDVIGWHRHETAGEVGDIAAIPDADGNWQVWLLVIRSGPSGARQRYVERLGSFAGGAAHLDGVFKSEFAARCIPCMPETNLDNGTTFTLVKKINAVKARVLNSMPFKARILSAGCQPSPLMDVPPRPEAIREPVAEADWPCFLASGFRDNARLELIFDGAAPATVLGLAISCELASEAGGQK